MILVKEESINKISESEEKALREPFLRTLWRECFQDTPEYENFYFHTLYKKNIVYEWNGKGMLHLNPYLCSLDRKERLLHYIVGVATKKTERRKGVMRKLLQQALLDLYEEKEPFTYLMPADVRYYETFGFFSIMEKKETDILVKQTQDGMFLKASSLNMQDEIVSRTVKWHISDPVISEVQFVSYEDCFNYFNNEEQNCILGKLKQWLVERYNIFAVHDKEYFDLLLKEKKCQGGNLLFCFDKMLSVHHFLGFLAYVKTEEGFVVEQAFFVNPKTEEACMDYFKSGYKRIESFPYMIRIVHAEILLNMFSECFRDFVKEEKKIFLTDSLLAENNGIYTFIEENNKVLVKKQKIVISEKKQSIEDSEKDIRMTEAELAEYIFSKNQVFFAEVV